ncbi:MAG: PAS domain S-box protein, partial [Campylobacterales bacterium]|nr:PAS domain S-box protein [Campylobacterales bacterium]
NTNFLYFNEAYSKILGYEKEELFNMPCLKLTAPEDVKRVKDTITLTKEKGFVENFETTYLVKANRRVSVNMALALMPDKQGLLISIKDITESKRKEKQIHNYVSMIDKNIITSSTNAQGKIIHVSEAFAKISGFTKEEMLGRDHSMIRHPDMPKKIFKELWQTISASRTWQGEVKNRKKDGSFYWVDMTISPNFDEYGYKIGYTAIRKDITDQKLVEELSITDSLTQVYNRRHFDDLIPKIINSAKR